MSNILTGIEVRGCNLRRSWRHLDAEAQRRALATLPVVEAMNVRQTIAVDLVRLYCAPDIQIAFLERQLIVERDGGNLINMSTLYEQFRSRFVTLGWQLGSSCIGDLRLAWQGATMGPNAGHVRFPLRRAGVAAQRQFDEDRLIDCWIGLEGLLMHKDDRRSAVKQVVTRAQRLLGIDDRQTRQLGVELGKSFGVRSAVVHGDVSYDDASVLEAISVAGDVLAKSLRTFIQSGQPIEIRQLG